MGSGPYTCATCCAGRWGARPAPLIPEPGPRVVARRPRGGEEVPPSLQPGNVVFTTQLPEGTRGAPHHQAGGSRGEGCRSGAQAGEWGAAGWRCEVWELDGPDEDGDTYGCVQRIWRCTNEGGLGDGGPGGGGVLSKSKEGVPGDVALGAGLGSAQVSWAAAPLWPGNPNLTPPRPRTQPSGSSGPGTSRLGLPRSGLWGVQPAPDETMRPGPRPRRLTRPAAGQSAPVPRLFKKRRAGAVWLSAGRDPSAHVNIIKGKGSVCCGRGRVLSVPRFPSRRRQPPPPLTSHRVRWEPNSCGPIWEQ